MPDRPRRTTRLPRRRAALALALAAIPLAAAGCSSTSNDDGDSTKTTAKKPTGPLLVGVAYSSKAGEQTKENGTYAGEDDGSKIAQAIVDDINAKGGAGGRQLKIEKLDLPLSYNDTAQAQVEQKLCASFTQDAKVEIALPQTFEEASENVLNCLKDTVTFSSIPLDEELRARYPNFYTNNLALDRAQSALIESLKRRGVIKQGTKVGIVQADTNPSYATVGKGTTEKLLKEAGADVVGYGTFDNRGLSKALRGLQGTVLKLKSKGAELIIPVDAGGAGVGVTATIAAQQKYLPVYGVTSHGVPFGVIASTGPKLFAGGLQGISWRPQTWDVAPDQRPAPSAAATRCTAIMKKAGLASQDLQALSDQTSFCDQLFAVDQALDGNGGDTTPAAFAEAIKKVKFESSEGGQLDFAKHTDGISAYRDLSLDKSGVLKLDETKEYPIP